MIGKISMERRDAHNLLHIIYTPKTEGALNLRRISYIAQIFLIKEFWYLLEDETSFWAHFMEGKYLKHATSGRQYKIMIIHLCGWKCLELDLWI